MQRSEERIEGHRNSIESDLLVIGAGIAGMSAALFGSNRGLRTVIVGSTTTALLSSGLIDLLGIHPVEEGKPWENPWDGMDALRSDIREHPYARMQNAEIQSALDEVLSCLEDQGVPYSGSGILNTVLISPIGSTKQTYRIPQTMKAGADAFTEKKRCLLVDFEGYREYSAEQIAGNLSRLWPGLDTVRVRFPSHHRARELNPEPMALSLENPENRKRLAEAVFPHLKGAGTVGFPAVLGIHRTTAVQEEIAGMLGLPVFEIPTLPVSVPAIRFRDAMIRGLRKNGVRCLLEKRVSESGPYGSGGFWATVQEDDGSTICLRSKGIILATGRFLGKGLIADRKGIRESLFDLPVDQPASRDQWHREDLFDKKGHPINRAGVRTDSQFRPLDRSGRAAHRNLFAAGIILAHQDWARTKCGSGLSIATAYGAVKHFHSTNRSESGKG